MTDVNDLLGHAGIAAGAVGVLYKLGGRLLGLLEAKWNAEIEIKKTGHAAEINEAKAANDERRISTAANSEMLRHVIDLLAKQTDQNDSVISELRGINSLDIPRRSTSPSPEAKG